DAVGDHDRVAAQVLDEGAPGVLADRDPRADLLQGGLEDRVRRDHRARARVGGVERGDDRALRGPAGQQAQRGRGGLVDVDDVEGALVQPAPYPGGRQEAEVQPGHGAVVRHWYRAAGRDDVRRERGVVVGGGEHGDLVAQADEVLGQVTDVELDAARDVPRVGADDADPRGVSSRAFRPGSRAGARAVRHTGWGK